MEILLTIPAAAAALSCGRTALYSFLKSKRLRAVKVGKSTRIPRSEIDKFISSLPTYNPTHPVAEGDEHE
ncbi:MAG TPA: helix-turn-helix domain-containing protein [Patescibacteria group bacterium]|nr:helix-turn-helix domain-containing protein [Patescibacteria group bacterium]